MRNNKGKRKIKADKAVKWAKVAVKTDYPT